MFSTKVKNMKKTVLAALMVTGFTLANAQTTKFFIGVFGGASFGKLKGNDYAVTNLQRGQGYAAGLTLEMEKYPCKGLGLNSGIQQKNFCQESNNYTSHYNLLYFSNHFFLRARFPVDKQHKHSWKLRLGGFYNALIRAENYATGEGQDPSARQTITVRYAKNDIGLSFGTGPAFSLSEKLKLTIEARYDAGLKDINAFPVFNAGDIKTSYFYLLGGLEFKL